MTVKNATELVKLIENTLGWDPQPTPDRPLWKCYAMAAGRVNKQVKKDPSLYTWHNLELAVELLRRKHKTVKSPVGVFFAVEEAVSVANVPTERPISDEIDKALAWEHQHHLPGWEDWTARLVRAVGPYRLSVLETWRKAREQ